MWNRVSVLLLEIFWGSYKRVFALIENRPKQMRTFGMNCWVSLQISFILSGPISRNFLSVRETKYPKHASYSANVAPLSRHLNKMTTAKRGHPYDPLLTDAPPVARRAALTSNMAAPMPSRTLRRAAWSQNSKRFTVNNERCNIEANHVRQG